MTPGRDAAASADSTMKPLPTDGDAGRHRRRSGRFRIRSQMPRISATGPPGHRSTPSSAQLPPERFEASYEPDVVARSTMQSTTGGGNSMDSRTATIATLPAATCLEQTAGSFGSSCTKISFGPIFVLSHVKQTELTPLRISVHPIPNFEHETPKPPPKPPPLATA